MPSSSTLDEIAAVVGTSWHKPPKARTTPVEMERTRAARCDPVGTAAPCFFRFTPSRARCCACGEDVEPPIGAARPAYLPRVVFATYCVGCVKTTSQ